MILRQLENLIVIEKDHDVIVIVPAEDVLLTTTTLPKLSKEKLKQALPYALEEQLIEEVNELHFATGERENDGKLPVAVVAKEKMQHWLNLLNSENISPTALVPATLALPFTENHWHIYTTQDTSLVRAGKHAGYAIDNANLEKFIQSHPATHLILTQKELQEQFLLGCKDEPAINLLQGAYVAKRKNTHSKHVWKLAGYAALAWIALVFFGNLISFLILHHEASKLDNQIAAIYHEQFPHANNVTAPRERMQQKLKEMTEAASKNNFLSLLATIAKATHETQGIRLQSLVYAANALTLEASASTFDALDTLTSELNNQGLTVKQQNAGIVGTQVKATLLITAGVS